MLHWTTLRYCAALLLCCVVLNFVVLLLCCTTVLFLSLCSALFCALFCALCCVPRALCTHRGSPPPLSPIATPATAIHLYVCLCYIGAIETLDAMREDEYASTTLTMKRLREVLRTWHIDIDGTQMRALSHRTSLLAAAAATQ
eukprot:COSAG05_NODE_1884_length_3893_cov_3.355825_3_plen_143_part_00